MEFLRSESRLKRIASDRQQLFQEFQAGLWTPAQYREMVSDLLKSPSAKRCHEHSPDWDEDLLETLMGTSAEI
jgi:hypothetical protein